MKSSDLSNLLAAARRPRLSPEKLAAYSEAARNAVVGRSIYPAP